VGRLLLRNADGRTSVRYWLINASIGLTADANRLFNRAPAPISWMKRVSTGSAIAAAALATLFQDRGRELTVRVNGEPIPGCRYRNLGLIKNPNFAGCLRYDTQPEPDGGTFHLHTVGDVSFPALLRILAGLARGRFAGRPGTRSLEAVTAAVSSERPFAVEFDGEVTEAVSVEASVLPRRLEVCA
jgi:diacylglycerol kinase family enzyme